MKRYFAKFPFIIALLIGIAVWAFPLSRRYAAVQLGLTHSGAPQIVSSVLPASEDFLRDDSWNEFLEKVQYKEDFNSADEYLNQHPEKIALLTERARYLIGNSWLPQRGGELDAPSSPPAPLGDVMSQEAEVRRQAKSKVLLQRVHKLCLLAQKQEPQNSYYDLLLSIVAYAQYRDNDGWSYLQTALEKPRFDPHYVDLFHMQVRNNERLLGRPLLWEEKLDCNARVLLRDLSKFRVWGRWLEWKSITQIRAGKPAAAMETMRALSGMGNKIVHEAKLSTVAQVGSALMAMAYNAPLNAQRVPTLLENSVAPPLSQEERYFEVQEYAKRHHLPQLQEIGIDYLRGKRYLANIRNSSNWDNYYGLSAPLLKALTASWEFGVWALFLSISALIFWCVTSFFKAPEELPSRRKIAITTGFTILMPLVLVGGFYAFAMSGDGWNANLLATAFPSSGPPFDCWMFRGLALLFPISIALVVSSVITFLTPWRQTWCDVKHSSWSMRLKVLLGIAGFILVPAGVFLLASNWPDEIDFVYQAILFYAMRPFSSFLRNEFDDVQKTAVYLIAYLILGITYLFLLWRFACAIRPQYKQGQIVHLMRSGLLSLGFCCIVIYGMCMISAVIVRKSAGQVAVKYYTNQMSFFDADKADLSGPVDPQEEFQLMEEVRKRIKIRL